jgi:general secretion pathway protein K
MARRLALLTNPRRDNSGFALIIVLWTLVLIAFIVAHLTADGRTELRIATNIIANATAQAAADGAIVQAIFNLSDPDPKGRWPVDGNVREVVVGNIPVKVRLEDEGWWINPSTASPPLVEALLRATGTDPEKARLLAIAISEWVGSVSVARPQNAILADYQAAGLNYTPPGAPLETLDELGRVLAMSPAILAVIRPHLTLFGPPDSLKAEVMTIGQLYRDRGDCENSFDELMNHWGWGGFTTHDLTRCRIMARIVALIFNWWNLFVRLADPDHHREAITSRPLLLTKGLRAFTRREPGIGRHGPEDHLVRGLRTLQRRLKEWLRRQHRRGPRCTSIDGIAAAPDGHRSALRAWAMTRPGERTGTRVPARWREAGCSTTTAPTGVRRMRCSPGMSPMCVVRRSARQRRHRSRGLRVSATRPNRLGQAAFHIEPR